VSFFSLAGNYYKSIRRPPKRSPHLKTDMGADGILLVGQRWFTAVPVGGQVAVWSKVSMSGTPGNLLATYFACINMVVF